MTPMKKAKKKTTTIWTIERAQKANSTMLCI